MLAPPQKRSAALEVREDSWAAARDARAAHPLAAMLNAGPRVRQLQAQAMQLNARRPAPPRPVANRSVAEPVVQGFWLEAAGLLGLGALGVAGYKWLQSRAAKERARNRRSSVVGNLLEETEGVAMHPDVRIGESTDEETISARDSARGGYRVNLNPERPFSRELMEMVPGDPHLRAITRLHELTHIAVFKGYGGRNAGQSHPINVLGRPGSQSSRDELDHLDDEHERIQRIARADPVLKTLPRGQQDFIHARIDDRMRTPNYEFDTVINELVYYFHLAGVPADSPLSQELVRLAAERQARRSLG